MTDTDADILGLARFVAISFYARWKRRRSSFRPPLAGELFSFGDLRIGHFGRRFFMRFKRVSFVK
ncbi:MAG TPA: hypothetical protein QF630_01950 [Alphaproteobacteria bacterium]|jgi:hypothetical protein|nr:hypothetical protein [Alphaproteobacteria bacterium]HJN59783.1 hypothetical protein [Alphaproteobacteria bacterium]